MSAAPASSVLEVIWSERRAFASVLGFSLAINLLGLTSSLYMLQIYDRVLSSYSIETLVALSLMATFAYLALAGLETSRTSALQRLGARTAHRLGPPAFQIQLRGSAGLEAPALQPLRDVDTIRSLVGGPATAAAFDLPWSPLYFTLLYMLHPVLFWLTITVGIVLAAIAILNDRWNSGASAAAAKEQLKALQFAEVAARAGETVVAMGATGSVSQHWLGRSAGAMTKSLAATEREARFHSLAKFFRNWLQTALLGVGAALTIAGELSSGGLIASSILGTRALAPIEAVIGAWKTVLSARQAWGRLDAALALLAKETPGMALPRPKGAVKAENVTLVPPGAQRPIISRVNFEVAPGEQLAIVGPSGSGKSTLIRAIMGLAPCAMGGIRIDGTDVVAWQKNDLGKWIGYLPQTPLPLAGTIAQNITRFEEAASEDIIAAAREANVHELIQSLPKGYDTELGPGGIRLSGGQVQRIALAAALIGQRPVIVLDEPEAHLDTEGEMQLRTTLKLLRDRKATVIIISHRPSAVANCEKLLVLRDGYGEFGPREEILSKIMKPGTPAGAPASGAPQRPVKLEGGS